MARVMWPLYLLICGSEVWSATYVTTARMSCIIWCSFCCTSHTSHRFIFKARSITAPTGHGPWEVDPSLVGNV